MFKSGGYNLSDIAAVTNNGRGDGLFGDNGWWIILLFLFAGWGNGFGGGLDHGAVPPGAGWATQADVRAAVDQQTLISKLDQQTYGLADSTYTLNNALTNGFHGVDNAICTLGYSMQGGFNNLSHQMSECCCAMERGVERGFSELNYNLATQSCDTRRAVADSTRDIIESNNAGVRSILDFLTQDKIATLTAENQSLRLAASQARQNAYLVNELRPAPVPAYAVPNPYCCYATGYTGYNCGCA